MAYTFPDYVVSYKLAKRHRSADHHFCAYCGKELTWLNYKTGSLFQQQHFLCETESGIQVRLCWRRDKCEERRKERYGEMV